MVSILTAMRCVAIVHALFAATLASAAFAQTGKPDPEEMIALLRTGDHAGLDSRLGAYQAAYEAASDAEWNALRAFAAFERVEPDLEGAFDAWVSARPQSYGARVARGAYLYHRAWAFRGSRPIGETAPERIAAMQRLFQRATDDLLFSLKLTSRPQVSHRYLIGIAMSGGDRTAAQRIYTEALRGDPENYGARRAYLNALRPQWGGSLEAMRDFVVETDAAAQTPKQRAVAGYLKASLLGYVGFEFERAKEHPRALQAYGSALAEAEDSIVLARRGRLLVQLKRQDEALRDLDRAIELEPTSGDALEHRGVLHEQRKRMKQAVEDYRHAAAYGSAYAMQRLGILHITGEDVLKNYAEAAKWLHLGAEFGDHRAQSYLGWMYSTGSGVPRDGMRALSLWYASAAQGNQDAQKYLDDVPWYWRARYKIEELWPK
jgi:tetratricopeptide (TPR) repeat protein